MKTYKLHLVRHGLTQGNLDGVFVGGGLDMPVCEQGQEELLEKRRRFAYPDVALVFSSPMKRALQSADLLFPDANERVVIEELRENIFGEFEGRRVDEMMTDERYLAWLDPTSGFVPAGGESGRDFAARTSGALLAMMTYLAQNGIAEAACVTHGGVIMSMLAQRALPQKPPHQWMSENGCGFTVQADAAMLMRDGMVEVAALVPGAFI